MPSRERLRLFNVYARCVHARMPHVNSDSWWAEGSAQQTHFRSEQLPKSFEEDQRETADKLDTSCFEV